MSSSSRSKKSEKSKKKKDKSKSGKKSKWKTMLKKMRDKSRERWKQISTSTKESKLGQMFQKFTLKHHLPVAAQDDSAMLLQKQLEEYQAQVEQRKNRAPEEMGHLREGDATLPYVPKPISSSLMNKLKQQSSDEPTSEVESTSSSSEDLSAPSPVAAVEPVPVPPPQETSERSNVSSRSSTSEDSSEKTGQLSNILMSIMSDAQKDSIRKEDEDNLQLPPEKLAMLSRKELEKFDKIVEENTKQGLFLSQPTAEERQHWNDRRARPHHMNPHHNPIVITTEQMEKRIFCHSCLPRHVNYPHMKMSSRT